MLSTATMKKGVIRSRAFQALILGILTRDYVDAFRVGSIPANRNVIVTFSRNSPKFRTPENCPQWKFRKNTRCNLSQSTTTVEEEGSLIVTAEDVIDLESIPLLEPTDPIDIPIKEQRKEFGNSFAGQIVAGSFLVTSNTIGAGMMVLPDVFGGPGLLPSSGILVGTYLINLLSGLLIAEVAIKQKEKSGSQVPSSFKEFTDVNFQSELSGNLIGFISVFVNWCTLAFSFVRAGNLASEATESLFHSTSTMPDILSGLDISQVGASSVALALAIIVCTQGYKTLSAVASASVVLLFASFAVLLLPGLAGVEHPIATILAQGTYATPELDGSTTSFVDAFSQALPFIVFMTSYQNIVPSVTKLLDYDRTKSVLAVVIGSIVPVFMYLSWCYAVLGGGIDTSLGGGGLALTAFSVSSITGSSLAGLMSIVEEFESFFSSDSPDVDFDNTSSPPDKKFSSLPSAVLGVVPPLLAGILFAGGDEFNAALSSAGGFASPILYGIVPVAIIWIQRTAQKSAEEVGETEKSEEPKDLIPGGSFSLVILAAASTALLGKQILETFPF